MRKQLLELDPSVGEKNRFSEWLKGLEKSSKEGCGDLDALQKLTSLAKSALAGVDAPKTGKLGSLRSADHKAVADSQFRLREHCHLLRRIEKELVGRVRSLRYFEAIRAVQSRDQQSAAVCCESCKCGMDHSKLADWSIMSCCGHQGCAKCVLEAASNQECLAAGCGAAARVSSIIDAASIVPDATQSETTASRFGTKLSNVVQCIEQLPADDRILVFVQFPDLAKAVSAALTESLPGLTVAEVKGTVIQKTKVMDSMQEDGGPRVLL